MTTQKAWVLLVGCIMPIQAAIARVASTVAPISAFGRPRVEGLASWYGVRHAGRLMANGRPFQPLALTAASPVLPLGTRVRVTNLLNDRSVVLTITDRGPFVPGRILDVSLGAAKKLRMVDDGVVWVRIELV